MSKHQQTTTSRPSTQRTMTLKEAIKAVERRVQRAQKARVDIERQSMKSTVAKVISRVAS